MTARPVNAAAPVIAALIEPLTDLVVQAGAAIVAVDRRTMAVEGKSDGSPVTAADLAADRILAAGVERLLPGLPVVSEERPHTVRQPCRDSFVLIDQLDGTREFVAGRDEFTVNLAIITDGVPVLGIVAAPALGVIWRGAAGGGAERLRLDGHGRIGERVAIRTRGNPVHGAPWVALVSRSHADAASEAFIADRPGAIREAAGSAVKFGRIAEGTADIYPRLAPTHEWDVAAGCAVVEAAGGCVTDGHGAPLRFGGGAAGFIVPGFIAFGDPAAARNAFASGGRRPCAGT
jgi:3'(2'), 5'-bisphosphate nucleotidase